MTLKRIAITLEYDGTAFAGFQWQKNGLSIQAVIEDAIALRFRETRRVEPASRTDAGVHAFGQVAVFDLEYSIALLPLVAALNSALPSTVRVIKARRVPGDWLPRRKAVRKTYEYMIFNRAIYSPLLHGRAWQVIQPLDLQQMKRAAVFLQGRHDFSSFRAAGCSAKQPIRNLQNLKIFRRGDMIKVSFTADAFLYHMVRNLTGTLVEVGKGRMTPERVKQILQCKDRRKAGPTAPAAGLYLKRIVFGKRKMPNAGAD